MLLHFLSAGTYTILKLKRYILQQTHKTIIYDQQILVIRMIQIKIVTKYRLKFLVMNLSPQPAGFNETN